MGPGDAGAFSGNRNLSYISAGICFLEEPGVCPKAYLEQRGKDKGKRNGGYLAFFRPHHSPGCHHRDRQYCGSGHGYGFRRAGGIGVDVDFRGIRFDLKVQ